CDETAVALVEDGRQVLSEVIASQADDFAAWGGVVPELAARGHVAALPAIIEQVLGKVSLTTADIDVCAVSAYPGLIGSLLCGVTAAKCIATRLDIPLIAVDHIQAHMAAVHLGEREIKYPLIALVASGGHSHYYLCQAPGDVELIGGTIDDAAGEAFDKAASCLNLDYPGGPNVDRHAQHGDSSVLSLPRPFRNKKEIKLSFAGLKTAFLYQVRGPMGKDPLCLDAQGINDACASFQEAVVDCLCEKLLLACEQYGLKRIAIGGGVACNSALRQRLQLLSQQQAYEVYMPQAIHCGDNAAMIASLGFFQWQRGDCAEKNMAPLPTGKAGPRKSG
ncbi:MAG: tRNA (adenosine(37)-N6)-threonylcarbamoyltransferase complex transferase subunit TsaD, partial [Planctomycetes bacterium]|nr:tRNA (adenosine(37)-N6)-threonylcarbamoyltransferase complex transferase subunit TsaD [Planctomycetota bacterium]